MCRTIEIEIPARWRSAWSVRCAVGRPGVYSLSRVIPKDFKKWYSRLLCLTLSTKSDTVENKPASLLAVSLGRLLAGRLRFYVADRWPTRTSPGYNCKVAHPACLKKRLLGTHQWQSALLVVGLPTAHDCFEMSCHLSPSLISIRLTA